MEVRVVVVWLRSPWRSGCGPAPPELDAHPLGDEEEVVAHGADVLVVEGDNAEAAIAVGPDEGCEVPDHPPLGVEAPGVGELQPSPREIQGDPPPLICRDLEVPGQMPCWDHGVLQVLRKGLLVGLYPGKVIRVVHRLRGSRRIQPALRDLRALGGIEPDERDRRAPQVLYYPERHVAPLLGSSDGLGEAHRRKTHVPRLPGMRLSYGSEPAPAFVYATNLFHDARILQLSSGRCPAA